MTVCSAAAYGAYKLVSIYVLHRPGPLALLVAALTLFVSGTAAMSIIIGLTETKPVAKVWTESYLWLFPYYLVGAAIAGLVSFLNQHIGWQASPAGSAADLPVVPLVSPLPGQAGRGKQHAEKVSSLHLRTIEALALAIEAKDQTTGEHLQRVRIYAMELARELSLTEDETEALRAAAVLHDIGKLAVPEHIICKPGKLTPEESRRWKIHPTVGAEILEQVDFPYPVVPIVRAHHEKWDGSGYPNGLAGEAIPIGARILSTVDCLDALASDRRYHRRALPLDQAMAKVASRIRIGFRSASSGNSAASLCRVGKARAPAAVASAAETFHRYKVERGLGASRGLRRLCRSVPNRIAHHGHRGTFDRSAAAGTGSHRTRPRARRFAHSR